MTTKIIKTDESSVNFKDLPTFEWFTDEDGDLGYKFAEDSTVFFNGDQQRTEGGVNPGDGWQVHRVDVEIEVI